MGSAWPVAFLNFLYHCARYKFWKHSGLSITFIRGKFKKQTLNCRSFKGNFMRKQKIGSSGIYFNIIAFSYISKIP